MVRGDMEAARKTKIKFAICPRPSGYGRYAPAGTGRGHLAAGASRAMAAPCQVRAQFGHAGGDPRDLISAVEVTTEDDGPGLWTSFGIALRLIVGWFCVAIGVLNLLAEVDRTTGEPDIAYFLFHVMLFAGGLVLLSVGALPRGPGVAGYSVGGAVFAAGLLISSIPVNNTVCCLSAFDVRHGYPFTLAARDGAGRWHIDSQHLLADLLFWGYAGLLALAVVALARAATAPRAESPEDEAVREHQPAGD
jgi:hypothetical protein